MNAKTYDLMGSVDALETQLAVSRYLPATYVKTRGILRTFSRANSEHDMRCS